MNALERRLGLTPAGAGVAAGALVMLALGFWLSSRSVVLMGYALVAVLAGSAIAGRRRLPVTAERARLPARIREGQTVAVELTVRARRSMVLEEQLDPLIGEPVRIAVARGGERTVGFEVTPRVRGVATIGPLYALWSDPFGLTRRRRAVLGAAEVLVHPTVERVRDRVLSREWEDPPVRPPISKPWPHGFEFQGMRDYVPGDDPRRIVWRAVARTGRYLVRDSEQGITDRVTLIVDTRTATHDPAVPSPTFETAVRAAASLGIHHMREGSEVSVETCEELVVWALRGGMRMFEFLDAMSRMRMGRAHVADAVERVFWSARRDTHHVLIATELDERTATMLRLLVERGASLTFVHVVSERPSFGTVRRAASVGAEVVELRVGSSLETVFRRAVGAGLR